MNTTRKGDNMKPALRSLIGSVAVFTALTCHADDFLDKFKQAAEQLQHQRPSQQQAQPNPPATLAKQAAQNVPAQSGSASDCCTPQATAKLAASAGYLDIVGIKLGMPAKQALEAMKADNPAFKIELQNVDFYWDCATKRVCDLSGQKKQWPSAIKGEVARTEAKGSETLEAHLTLPPNSQVVSYLSRTVIFPNNATPTIDNVLAGLRKKYGAPTYSQPIGIPQLKWFFDSQGHLLDEGRATKLGVGACQPGDSMPIFDVAGTGYRGKTAVSMGQCESAGVAIVMAQVSPTTTGGNMAGLVTVSMVNVPLLSSAVNTTNAALDHLLKEYDDKKLQQAEKVGGPKF
jgi:hypothetical protein